MIVPIIVGVVLLIVVGLVVTIYVFKDKNVESIDDRLSKFTEATLTLEDLELERPFSQRVLIPLAQSALNTLGKFGPKQNLEKTKKMISSAGNPGGLTPVTFTGIRMGMAVGLTVVFGIVTFSTMQDDKVTALMYTGLGLMLGYMLPGMWLGSKIKERKNNIVKALPDALDLLTISVEAGLGFDIALKRVTEKWDDDLSREFKRVLLDISLGKSRREALRDMAERCDVEDVQIFTSAIIQAEQLGVSIAKILKLQSDQMRDRRRQRAEEKAQQAPVLMLFPMVFFIFPSIFVVILGPAVPKIMSSTGGI
jgi:tight adherence protein C